MSIKNRVLFLEKLRQAYVNVHHSANFSDKKLNKTNKLDKLDIEDRLFIAILLNSPEVIQHLLEAGADPNATNKHGTTLLQMALAFKREDVASLLLKYGAMPTLMKGKKLRF